MSWKTETPGPSEVPAAGKRRRSIARRLALLHILAVLVSYSIFGALFYSQRMRQLEQESLKDLAAERASVVAMMAQPDARVLLGYEIRTQQFEPEHLRPFLRVLDREGRILLESPWLAAVIPQQAFPAPGAAPILWRNPRGDYFLVESVRLPRELFGGAQGVLQLGINTRQEKELGNQLRLTLVAFLSCGLLFAFGCAYFIVRLAMKPLDDISRTARNITQRRLDTRIDSEALPAELVSLADSFNSMLGRLEDSFARLSHYSANLAHELRTPINTLMIESDIALAKERSPQEYRQVIASGLEEYGRLSWTIDRLLFLARADLEAHELNRKRLDLRAEIDDIFDYFFDAACESGVTLEVRGAGTLWADQTLLRRAISNLITNAIAYTPMAGAIEVEIEQLDREAARVTVADNGWGIGREHLPRIFDRFYRVEPAAGERKAEGTGLGLAIVKTIMQMHGGSVGIQSEPGRGTRVTLEFPAPPAAAAALPGVN
jgi:two-component system, OmpR family, heavy metal sensor histidine kinase CusS